MDRIAHLPGEPVAVVVAHAREEHPAIPSLQAAWTRWRWDFDLGAEVPITGILYLDVGPWRSWVRIGRDPEMKALPLRFVVEPFDRSNRAVSAVRFSLRRLVHGENNQIQCAIEDPRLSEDPAPLLHTSVESGEGAATGTLIDLARLDAAGGLRASVLLVPTAATRGGRTGTWQLREKHPDPLPPWLGPLNGGRRTGRCPHPHSQGTELPGDG